MSEFQPFAPSEKRVGSMAEKRLQSGDFFIGVFFSPNYSFVHTQTAVRKCENYSLFLRAPKRRKHYSLFAFLQQYAEGERTTTERRGSVGAGTKNSRTSSFVRLLNRGCITASGTSRERCTYNVPACRAAYPASIAASR